MKSAQKAKADDNPRYVRILYLKEVKKAKPLSQQDEPFSDKKSVAYLSSLIQDERKGSIDAQMASTRPEQPAGFLTTPTIVNRRRPNSFHEVGSHTTKHQSTKQNSLTELLGEAAFSATKVQFNLKKKVRPQLKLKGCLNKELKQQFEKDFVRFCIDVKPTGRTYPYKCLIPTSKTASELTYHDQMRPHQLNWSVAVPSIEKERTSQSINRTQDLDRVRLRRNIIYRKNFKQMENFGWAKVAEHDFNLL